MQRERGIGAFVTCWFVLGHLGVVEYLGVRELILELRYPLLVHPLRLPGRLVFSVFAEITVLSRPQDFFGQIDPKFMFYNVELFL